MHRYGIMTQATLLVVGELPEAVAHLVRSLQRCRYTTTLAGYSTRSPPAEGV